MMKITCDFDQIRSKENLRFCIFTFSKTCIVSNFKMLFIFSISWECSDLDCSSVDHETKVLMKLITEEELNKTFFFDEIFLDTISLANSQNVLVVLHDDKFFDVGTKISSHPPTTRNKIMSVYL